VSAINVGSHHPGIQSECPENGGFATTESDHSPLWVRADRHPGLTDGELHVWLVELDRPGDELSALADLLSADERERAGRFHFERDKQHFTAGRGILRTVLGRYLSLAPTEFAFAYGLRGKPGLPGTALHFNLAHSGGLAVIAVARGSAVGIDVEQIRVVPSWDSVMNSFFSAAEREAIQSIPSVDRLFAFFTCWTRKEAYLKATGDGIGVPLDRFEVSVIPGSQPRLLHVKDAPEEASRWHFHALPLATDYIGVAAHEGPIEIVRHYLW
jgi:4'-phosphopantetheinyl transferase